MEGVSKLNILKDDFSIKNLNTLKYKKESRIMTHHSV